MVPAPLPRRSVLRRIETLLDPTGPYPDPPPHAGLVRFYWHYICQLGWLAVALYVAGGVLAVLDTMLPTFIGRVVGVVSTTASADVCR